MDKHCSIRKNVERNALVNHVDPEKTTHGVQIVEPTFWQRWTRDVSVREKADSSGRRTVHARDAHSMWSFAIFYGHELQLVCLEVTLMGAMDLALHNTLISAVVTWMVSAALAVIRRELGRRNLARCTLVDIRFLS
jgi:Meckelin (Transmembrane protein 67)